MSDPRDIVERLQSISICDPECEGRCSECPADVVSDGIAAITSLRQRAEAAERGLEEMADHANKLSDHYRQRVAELEARETDNPCLRSLAEGEPCKPDAKNLRRCTICGFVVDIAYEAKKPTIDFTMAGRGNPPNTAALRARIAELEAALRPFAEAYNAPTVRPGWADETRVEVMLRVGQLRAAAALAKGTSASATEGNKP